jgi:Family of unknown function (DUF6338)
MGLIAKDLPALIFMLLPGFISAGVFYTLTAHPKTSEFERLVQSLIFTSFIKLGTILIKPLLFRMGHRYSFGAWDADVEYIWSIGLALILGLLFAFSANKDVFHRLFRLMNLSTRTPHPSEWYSVFSNNKRYVLLHLKGSRRLRGWAEEWPDQPDKGHFVILEAEWILSDDQIAPLYQVERFLMPATEVEMVEFLKRSEEITQNPQEVERVRNLLLAESNQTKGSNDGSKSTSAAT